VGFTETAKPEGPKSKTRRTERDGVIGGKRCFPPHQTTCIGAWGRAVSFPSGIRGKALATWRFRTFYRLTEPLLVSILLIVNLFQWNFVGPSHIRPPQPNFCGAPDRHGIGGFGAYYMDAVMGRLDGKPSWTDPCNRSSLFNQSAQVDAKLQTGNY